MPEAAKSAEAYYPTSPRLHRTRSYYPRAETLSLKRRRASYLPESFIFQTSKLIYGNKLAIFCSKKELVAVIIASPDIAQSERRIFDIIRELLGS